MDLMTAPAAGAPPTMTSREIAELTGKAHPHVTRDIRELLDVLKKDASIYGYIFEDSYGRPQPGFRLPKDLTLTLISGYSAPLRHRIITRWQELEQAQAKPAELTRLQLLQLALESEQERIALAAQLEQAAPAVEFMGKYVDAKGLKGLREVCKLLDAGERDFTGFLRSAGVMYKLAGKWTPYAPHIDAGRFVVRAGISEASGFAFTEAKFTPKGIQWIAGEWAKHQLKAAI